MTDIPFISICIPAYKNRTYLQRILTSIEIQTYKNFEVIITDDSNNDDAIEMVKRFSDKFSIQYFKNETALGTPANWNFAIAKARGAWIKLIHYDDWFASAHSLEKLVNATKLGHSFIFCAYANCVRKYK